MDSQKYSSEKHIENVDFNLHDENYFDWDDEDLSDEQKRYNLENPSGLEMYRFSCYFTKLQKPDIKIKYEYNSKGLYVNIPFVEIIFGLNKYDHGFNIFNLIIV